MASSSGIHSWRASQQYLAAFQPAGQGLQAWRSRLQAESPWFWGISPRPTLAAAKMTRCWPALLYTWKETPISLADPCQVPSPAETSGRDERARPAEQFPAGGLPPDMGCWMNAEVNHCAGMGVMLAAYKPGQAQLSPAPSNAVS